MSDFLALAASCSNSSFEKEIIVIGMMKMPIPGNHTAENIKICIEKIIGEYKFDKSKIVGIVSDEGSSLVRLFSQLLLDKTDQQPQSEKG